MVNKKNLSVFTFLKVLFLTIIVSAILLPLCNIVAVSFSSNKHIMLNDISIFPKGFNLDMYRYVLSNGQIFTAYRNTIFYVILGTTLSLIVTCAAAYALSKKKLIFQKGFMILIIITMFFSGGMIPLFLTVKALGMYNTTWAVILPNLVIAYNLIIMRTFFAAFPEEIEESGKLDGLNDIGILWYLVLPVSKAVIVTISLFYAVGIWNSYFYPFIFLESQDKFPLQLILRSMLQAGMGLDNTAGAAGDQPVIVESLKYATIIVSVIPIIAVYPFLQKYFVKGVMLGAVKG